MTLYRAHDTRNVWIAWLALVGFVAYLVAVMAHLIAVANTPAPFLDEIQGDIRLEIEVALTGKEFQIYCLLPLSVIIPIVLFNLGIVALYSRHVSDLRAIAQRDPFHLRPAGTQPQSDLALAAGETLTLARTQTRGERNFRVIGFIPLLLVPLTTVAPLLILLPSPYVSPISPPLPAPYNSAAHGWLSLMGPLDWLSAALPLVLIAAWIPFLLIMLSGRHTVLAANGRGLTYLEDRQRQFIAWDDIQLFLLVGGDSDDSLHQRFLIFGERARLEFSIAGPDDAQPHTRLNIIPYTFSGGYEAYESDARRLLATIAARSRQPLTYWTK
jgi:hypothetical protein